MSAPAVVASDLAKVYRRFVHQNQFRTLKSALLTGSLLSDLTPDQTFTALDGVSFEVPRGCTFGVIGENGSGKSTLLKLLAGITKPTRGSLVVARPRLGPDRAGGRLPPRDQRPRERGHQRHHAGADPARGRAALRRDRGLRRAGALHRRAGQDLLLGHVHAPGLRGGDPRRPRGAADRRGAGGGRRGLHAQVPGQDRRVPPARQDHRAGLAQPGAGREDVRRRAVGAARQEGRPGRPQARGGRLPDVRGGRRGGLAATAGPGRRGGPAARDRAGRGRARRAATARGAGAAGRSRSPRCGCATRAAARGTSTSPARA